MNLHVVAAEFVLDSSGSVFDKWLTLFLLVFVALVVVRGIDQTFWHFTRLLTPVLFAVLAIGGLMLFSNERKQPGDVRVSAEISRTPGVVVERSAEGAATADQPDPGGDHGSAVEGGQSTDWFSHSHRTDSGLADHTHP